MVDNKINRLIPNRNQSPKKFGKLNENQYHKDHFEYDYKQDAFKCQKENIYSFLENISNHRKTLKPDKIKRIYNNYEVCKNFKEQNKCYSAPKHIE